MECLDEETVLAFVRGDLPPERRRQAHDHITACDECRALVSAVARSSMVDERKLLEVSATELADSGGGGQGTAPVRPGDVLAGKYVVDGILGVGGMGVVVSARQTQLDRRVAVKFLLPAACEVPGAVARFLREGKAAARITSEHVARVIDTGVLDGGAPYLVMEYLEGSDLSVRGRIAWADAVEYVLQACEAIVEAHTLGIVHRDLKPANLFLTKRADGTPLVKVLDFGISKVEGGSRRDLTTASMLMGSPRYMSPEQMLSAKDVDARTDVWALGVILYELVTGKPVWDADTVHGLSALIATAPAPPLRESAPDAPPALESVVARCLAKSREARVASVADLALALEPIAPARAHASIDRVLKVAGRDRIAASVAPPSSRSPLVPLIAAAVGVLLVAGVGLNVLAAKKKGTPPPVPIASAEPLVSAAPPPPVPSAGPAPSAIASAVAPTPSVSVAAAPPKSTVVAVKKVVAAPPPPATVAASATPPPPPKPASSSRALIDRK